MQTISIPTSAGPHALETELSLNCATGSANPESTFKWFKDGAVIGNDSSYSMNTTEADHGKTYRCQATNIAGANGAEITLIVERKRCSQSDKNSDKF